MRKIALLLCAAMLLSLLAGCGGKEPAETTAPAIEDTTVPTTEPVQITAPGMLTGDTEAQTELFTMAFYPKAGFNPYSCTGINNRMLFSLLYQGLFRVDREYNAEPVLCRSFTVTEDLTEYTFYLEDATFADGTAVQATDVVASLNTAWDSEYYTGRFTHVDSITEAGGNAVRVELDTPMETLPLLLDIPIVKYGQQDNKMPQGTGPYVLKQTSTGLSLQRRQDWWCSARLPLDVQGIPLVEAESPAQIRDSFEFSDVGISTADPGSASYAEYRCDYELWEAESGVFLYLGCNKASSVLSNNRLRLALSFAIDRQAVLNDSYNGFGVPTTLAASPHSPFYDKGLANQVTFDPQRLTDVVTELKMTGRTLRLLVNKSDSIRLQAARQIAKMIAVSGLNVEILECPGEEYVEMLRTDEWDFYLGQTKLSPNMDMSAFFHNRGGLSYGEMADETTYEMCMNALENSGNYYNLHQMILRDGQLIPILFRTHSVYAKRGLVQELHPARDDIFYYTLGKSLDEARTVLEETEKE